MNGNLGIEFWHWWVAAVALAAGEMLAPGAILVWLGGSAGLVGLVLLIWPGLDWHIQFLLFSGLAIVAVFGSRAIARNRTAPAAEAHLNRRAEQYLGMVLSLESPIVNGRGRAHVGDSLWPVEGPDLPQDASVRVIGVEGVTLVVEKADRNA